MRWLVLLAHGTEVDAIKAPIARAACGRLVIAEAASAHELTEQPAVVAVTDRVLPEGLAAGLTESEAIFATAFAARPEKPARIGEGLPWDAAGFEPPDAPHDLNAESNDQSADLRGDDDV